MAVGTDKSFSQSQWSCLPKNHPYWYGEHIHQTAFQFLSLSVSVSSALWWWAPYRRWSLHQGLPSVWQDMAEARTERLCLPVPDHLRAQMPCVACSTALAHCTRSGRCQRASKTLSYGCLAEQSDNCRCCKEGFLLLANIS